MKYLEYHTECRVDAIMKVIVEKIIKIELNLSIRLMKVDQIVEIKLKLTKLEISLGGGGEKKI